MLRTHEQSLPEQRPAEQRPLDRPVGPVVARFRSYRLDWTDPDTGDR